MEENRSDYTLMANLDQAAIAELAGKAAKQLCKRVQSVAMLNYRGPGYLYQDFVVTIRQDSKRKKLEVVRNRDAVVVLAVDNGRMIAVNYEYIFVERHLNDKVSTGNG